jgi:hypothetical protein
MKKNRKQREVPNPMAGEMAPPPERQYYSAGFVCGMIQQSPDFVFHLMRQAGVEFAWTQDGIGLIRGDDLQKMAALVKEHKDEVSAAPFN